MDIIGVSENRYVRDRANPRDKIFIGSADSVKLLHERVGHAISVDEFEHLPSDVQDLHTEALGKFLKMEKNPDVRPLLTAYCDALESSDFKQIEYALSSVQGTNQLVEVAKANYIKQLDRLFLGGNGIGVRQPGANERHP